MSLLRSCFAGLLLLPITGHPAWAQAGQGSLLSNSALASSRAGLFQRPDPGPPEGPLRKSASLFAGTSGASLFAPLPRRQDRLAATTPLGTTNTRFARLRDLIAQAESGALGYDAVQHGAARKPAKRPTQMTLGEIYDWISRTPNQQHAIGRYQFIPATLQRLAARRGLGPQSVFSAQVQDHLADLLLAEAGLAAFTAGDIGRHRFMNNLAKIWAGLPTTDGESYYHGLAGNRATMSWAYFDAQMVRIFPG